jgi:hypothetical protein
MTLRAPATFGFALGVLVTIISPPAARASVVTNGDFETGDIAPWDGGSFIASNVLSYAGTYHAFGHLLEFGSFGQFFLPTLIGHTYDISFAFRTDFSSPIGGNIHVFWNGADVLTVNAVTTWSLHTISGLTADTTSSYLRFQALRTAPFPFLDAGYHFDNVVVEDVTQTATPLPAALPIFATGLGALWLLGWRRNMKAARVA